MTDKNWYGKPYYSLDAYFKNTYGHKCYKLAVDAGFTCPNRDGKLDDRGCIFCSAGGSGDFAVKYNPGFVDEAIKRLNKETGESFVVYFQAYTNTYAPIEYLRKIYCEALDDERVCGISIATRPDCLDAGVLALLDELNTDCKLSGKFIWVELGLQTIHEKTAIYIRRHYDLSVYDRAVENLSRISIPYITHIILGLPGETKEMMLETVRYATLKNPFGIKLQLLHVLEKTDLCRDYKAGIFEVMTQDEYIDLVIDCLKIIPPDVVIHRLTGDGPKDILVAPLWSGYKKQVLNELHHRLKLEGVLQGQEYG
jgi:radical SAM protein (TIGR01212 family)